MNKIEIVNAILEAPMSCAELREAAEGYLAAIGTEDESICAQRLIAEAEEDVMTNENVVAFMSSEMAASVLGKETADRLLAHHRQLLADGVKYCDCAACTAGKLLLDNKDLFL